MVMVSVNVIEERKDLLRIEIDEDMGLLAAIAEKLNEMANIESATVVKKHPYMEKPVLVVRGSALKSSIKKAISALKAEVEEFMKGIEGMGP